MLDVVMIGIFVVLVASMASLASWSDKVVKRREAIMTIALSVIVAAITVYLVYALLNPEKF